MSKNDKCSTKDGEGSLSGDANVSEGPSTDGVSFVKNAVPVSKSRTGKRSLITRMLQEEGASNVGEDFGGQIRLPRRGRREERETNEDKMSRSQSI